MPRRSRIATSAFQDRLPALPLGENHWRAVVKSLGLSSRQAEVTELLLRGASDKEIVKALGIKAPTLRTYRDRIAARTGTRNRMELAMRVLAMSLEVKGGRCRKK